MPNNELLDYFRRVMDSIHNGGNIYYDSGRMAGYCAIALLASNLRNGR